VKYTSVCGVTCQR